MHTLNLVHAGGVEDIEVRQEKKDNVWLQKSLTALLRHKLHVVIGRRREQGVCVD